MKTWKELCKEVEEYKNWHEANLERLASLIELDDEDSEKCRSICDNFMDFIYNKYPELYEILKYEDDIKYYLLDYIDYTGEIPYDEYKFFEDLILSYDDDYNIVESLCPNFYKSKYIQEYLKSK